MMTLSRYQLILQLHQFMSRRGLKLTPTTTTALRRVASEKIAALSQILVTEGKYNFIGECEVMGLHVVCKKDGQL